MEPHGECYGDGNPSKEELLAHYHYLDSILESMLDAVIVANPDGTIRTVNRAAFELLGYSENELIGQLVGMIFEEEEEEEEEEFFKGTGWVRLLREGAVRNVELTLLTKSGERIPVLFNGSVIREKDGRLAAVVGVARDIREHKKAKEKLEHINLVLHAIRNTNRLITREKDRNRLLRGTCENLTETHGYYNAWCALFDESGRLIAAAEAGLGKGFLPLVEQLKRGKLPNCGQKALSQSGIMITEDPPSACVDCPLAGKYSGRGALTTRLEHGGRVYGLLSASIPKTLVADEEEQVLFQEVASDIALALHNIELEEERKQAEEALKASKAYTESIIQNFLDTLIVVDAEAKIKTVNPATCQLLGYTEEELIGQPVGMIFEEEEEEEVNRFFSFFRAPEDKEALGPQDTIRNWELTYKTKDGRLIPMSFNASVLTDEAGNITGVVAGAKDITEIKQAEKALRESEEKYRSLIDEVIESSNVGLFILDANFRIVWLNKALERFFGLKREEVIGKDKRQLIQEKIKYIFEDPDGFADRVLSTYDDNTYIENFECHVLPDPGREECWLEHWSQPIKLGLYTGGRIEHYYDITKRKEAERALQDSEERYRILVESSLTGVFIHQDGRYVFVNERFARMHGYTAEELIGRSYLELIHPEDREAAKWRTAQRMKGKILPGQHEIRRLTKDGRVIWCQMMVVAVQYKGRPADMGNVVDITERKQAEEGMKEAIDRLHSVLEHTIYAFASTIEKRDPYTAGHQRRVAQLALVIAEEMGLPREECRGIYMAGLVHDIGKISVPAEILSKPGRLTDVEFGMLKAHPQVGYDILKEVDFPWPLAEIVLQHHERLDGSGYPQGLKDGEILLGARILAVADVVEAMASHRPYRPALGIDVALEEISRGKGIFYDPRVVDTCIRLFGEKGYQFE